MLTAPFKVSLFSLVLTLAAAPSLQGSLLSAPRGALSLGSITLTTVYPRIFTPNGDGSNDKVGFHLDNPELLPVEGKIFDLSGARVANLTPAGTDPSALLVWDGKDGDGRSVTGGIYLYQLDFHGKVITGTVVVAR